MPADAEAVTDMFGSWVNVTCDQAKKIFGDVSEYIEEVSVLVSDISEVNMSEEQKSAFRRLREDSICPLAMITGVTTCSINA